MTMAQATHAADLPVVDLPSPVAAALQAAGVPPESVSMLVLVPV